MKCLPLVRKKWRSFPSERKSAPAALSASNHGGSTDSASCASEPNRASSKSSGSASSAPSIDAVFDEKAQNLRVFEFGELSEATKNFNPLLKIGEGGFGCVYKGFVKAVDGRAGKTAVAIKKLHQNSWQGHKEWLTEVRFLAVVDHPNLVKLIGYCATDTDKGIERLLVYEYMPNKTLEYHLFNKACPVLPWDVRVKIVLDVAQGLRYLHEGLSFPVIFRDFKTANVLMDESMNPKLSDFGLAREGPSDGRSHVSTAVMGTHGYAAPEYIETGHLTMKSDLWAFGVVLFEILTGRRALDRNKPKDEQRLLEWVKKFPPQSSKFATAMDPRLERRFPLAAARKMAELANACLAKNPRDRPTMGEVVEILKENSSRKSHLQGTDDPP
ncbi:serine/threonine-protein kinase PCRK1-like [Wolffia australiana]